MNKKIKTASILLYIIAFLTVCFGLLYLFTPKIMPYHERFLGMTHEQLEPRVASLFLFMLKGAGGAFLSLGITLFMVVKFPFSRGEQWAWWTIFLMLFLSMVPMLFITITIGLYTPWWLLAIMNILFFVAMIVSKSACRKK
jgi:hypothetical protein